MKTNWSTFNYNYAAVEPTLLSAIDFLTNGTVNRIICDDDRINCNVFSSVIFIKLGHSVYIFVQYISQSMVILTSKEKMKLIFNLLLLLYIVASSDLQRFWGIYMIYCSVRCGGSAPSFVTGFHCLCETNQKHNSSYIRDSPLGRT